MSKIFIIFALLVILNILLYVFIMGNIKTKERPGYGKETIPDSTQDSNIYIINMYYTEWCGWSQKVKPEFIKFNNWLNEAKNNLINNNHIHTNMYDVENPKNEKEKKEIDSRKIKSYPTILIFNPKTRLIDKYEGKRDFESFKHFVNNLP